ncbi:hypothetical protein CN692_13255 [Bacillus sp. AFS002410]|uniref:hypothetical protein n=1 Tax=Bacillus sp. AFS002410 TaxID=2033481 RepID=UPI000BF0F404|nr:hypothetical protein [Bacillus sp. AFS002410]PEJ57375.1 hypothetical protein CN692_13255 [Bacillus sp. AFS002410]
MGWRWLTLVCECILAIPLIGGLVVISSHYSALLIMLVLHIIAIVASGNRGLKLIGSKFGIITCLLGWIPFLGMILHMLTAIILLVTNLQDNNKIDDREENIQLGD